MIRISDSEQTARECVFCREPKPYPNEADVRSHFCDACLGFYPAAVLAFIVEADKQQGLYEATKRDDIPAPVLMLRFRHKIEEYGNEQESRILYVSAIIEPLQPRTPWLTVFGGSDWERNDGIESRRDVLLADLVTLEIRHE